MNMKHKMKYKEKEMNMNMKIHIIHKKNEYKENNTYRETIT